MEAKFIGGGNGGRPGTMASSFKDTFQRANSNNLGLWGNVPSANTNNAPSVANASIVGNKMQLGGNAACHGFIYPIPLVWMQSVVVGQFAECTVNAGNANVNQELAVVTGLQVGNPNQGAYVADWGLLPSTDIRLIRQNWANNNGITSTILTTFVGSAPLVTDVIRIQAIPKGSGTWALTVFKNGVALGTQNDNNLPVGMPSFMTFVGGVGGTITLSEFAAGVD